MAESDQGDKTEDPTPERRQEFRNKGQIAVSREITGVVNLGASALFLAFMLPYITEVLSGLFVQYFSILRGFRINSLNFSLVAKDSFIVFAKTCIPIFIVTTILAIFTTFMQTKVNWAWQKIKPDFAKMNPLKGLKNMVNLQALVNLIKGILKMCAVALVSYLILFSEWGIVPGLLKYSLTNVWTYWGEINLQLFYSVSGLLIFVAAIDYTHNYFSIEKQLKMSKQEVKEDLKKHEIDPHVKGRMKRMQRDIVFSKTISATRDATVVVTNPTHFAVALKYELGMKAPIVVAKGKDELALYMREVAKESSVPIMENKPLARFLYRAVEVGSEVPENVYKAVSEIIRYVFKMKNKSIKPAKPRNQTQEPRTPNKGTT